MWTCLCLHNTNILQFSVWVCIVVLVWQKYCWLEKYDLVLELAFYTIIITQWYRRLISWRRKFFPHFIFDSCPGFVLWFSFGYLIMYMSQRNSIYPSYVYLVSQRDWIMLAILIQILCFLSALSSIIYFLFFKNTASISAWLLLIGFIDRIYKMSLPYFLVLWCVAKILAWEIWSCIEISLLYHHHIFFLTPEGRFFHIFSHRCFFSATSDHLVHL